MSVTIKSEHELEKMREAGRILGIVHDEMAKIIRPGISTMDINRKGEEVIRSFGCIPSFLNYNGYPASICVSVNDEVVHGIPSKKRILQEGDIVSLDAGVIYEGYHSDAARTHAVGQISEEDQFLIDVTKQSFFEGTNTLKRAIICTIFPKLSRTMQKQTDFLLCAIWLAMELEEIFTRNHRCQTLSRLDEV